MSKLLVLTVLSFAVAGNALGQSKGPAQDQSHGLRIARTLADDSLFPGDQPLFPLNLGSPGDTLEGARPSLLPGDRPWMAEPETARPAVVSLESLLEMPPPDIPGHAPPPFQRDSWLLQSRSNLMSPWRLQMRSAEKYRIWRTIFGSIQAGGMAYLMYLHFKKYGLK